MLVAPLVLSGCQPEPGGPSSSEAAETSDPSGTAASSGTLPTDASSTTDGGGPAACNNGELEVGEVCLGAWTLLAQEGTAPLRLADLDNDERTDFVAGSALFLQQPDGTFAWRAPPTSDAPLQVGEFDDDGNSDIFTYDFYAGQVHRFQGNGDATFLAPPVTSTIGEVLGLRAVDIDADGRDELAGLGDTFAGPIKVWTARPDGGFDPLATYALPGFDFEVADFDADGHPDLAVAGLDLFQIRWGAADLEFSDGFDVMQLGMADIALAHDVSGPALALYSNFIQYPAPPLNRLVLGWPERADVDSWPFAAHDLGENDTLVSSPSSADMNADGLVDLLVLLRDNKGGARRLEVLCQTAELAFSVCASAAVEVEAKSVHPLHANADAAIDLLLATEYEGIWLALAQP
ncbi:FG-GAP repeat domain-containing protein [Nannocystis bainbridge]|uniref:VCBS repeat-containing protein n=1 Tax=Nannocystis bainbridge TaxID=2995303 RepID=A0ABT5DVK8_9BACT|nr:VCBS repeat-containing protein [Nannocystis bainbridge]MDC0717185.1 VCBS repeat-containing protein [Nannocystis bainbridge]